MKKFRQGAASFYIVAFSTLLLTIIAVSFATVILSELSRSSRSDVSQSAYDSALAGVEDAKAAYLNYQSCLNQGAVKTEINYANASLTCGEIIHYMEQATDEPGSSACDAVGHVLGRLAKSESGAVTVEENSQAGNNMSQAYTCVKVNPVLDDYRSQLTSDTSSRLITVHLDNASASAIRSLRLSWYSDVDGTIFNYSNYNNGVVFPQLSATRVAVPPTISIQLIQTAPTFTLAQLESSQGNSTDRGTLYLVPVKTTDAASSSTHKNRTDGYLGAYNFSIADNYISTDGFVKSNDKTALNVPYTVYCPENSTNEFACSVAIDIPNPVGDTKRNADTFMFVVSLPYGQPDTDFSLELCKVGGTQCDEIAYSNRTNPSDGVKARFRGTQIGVDSTGRADVLFRRVEARIDTTDIYFPHPEYAVQLLGTGTTLDKTFYVASEHNF